MGFGGGSGDGFFFGNFEDADLGVADGVGVVIHVDAFYVGFALIEIEALDVVLLALVQIDRFGMDCGESGGEIYFADHFGFAVFGAVGAAGDVRDYEIIGGDGAEADRIGWIGLLDPVPVFAAAMEETRFGEAFTEGWKVHGAEAFFGASGSSNAAHFR